MLQELEARRLEELPSLLEPKAGCHEYTDKSPGA